MNDYVVKNNPHTLKTWYIGMMRDHENTNCSGASCSALSYTCVVKYNPHTHERKKNNSYIPNYYSSSYYFYYYYYLLLIHVLNPYYIIISYIPLLNDFIYLFIFFFLTLHQSPATVYIYYSLYNYLCIIAGLEYI